MTRKKGCSSEAEANWSDELSLRSSTMRSTKSKTSEKGKEKQEQKQVRPYEHASVHIHTRRQIDKEMERIKM